MGEFLGTVLFVIGFGLAVAAIMAAALALRWLWHVYLYLWQLAPVYFQREMPPSGETGADGEVPSSALAESRRRLFLLVKDGAAVLAEKDAHGALRALSSPQEVPPPVLAEATLVAGTRSNGLLCLGPEGQRWAKGAIAPQLQL